MVCEKNTIFAAESITKTQIINIMKHILTPILVLALMAAGVFSLSSSTASTATELSPTHLLDLLYNYEGSGRKPDTPLQFICRDDVAAGDMELIQVVYGHDVEKGSKKAVGYELKATSPHGCYFCVSVDNSTQASLNFKDLGDAERFFDRLCKTESISYNGKTYLVQTKADDKYLYLATPWGCDEYENHFAVCPPVKDKDYYKIEIELCV